MSDPIFDSALLSMCMTWRHDFGLLGRKDQMEIKRELLGLYEHHVMPAIDRAETAEADLSALRQQLDPRAAEVARLTGERDALKDTMKTAQQKIGNACADREFFKHGFDLESKAHRERTAERDAAVARAERAEAVLRKVITLDVQGDNESNNCEAWGMCLEEAVEIARAYFAAAQDAKPAYRALEPEPWGGPEGGGIGDANLYRVLDSSRPNVGKH